MSVSRTVLVINSGSSSIKYQLVDPDTGAAIAVGLVERIGETEGVLTHEFAGEKHTSNQPFTDHGAGLEAVIEKFSTIGPDLTQANMVACGHRVVQGGSHFSGPALIDETTLGLIEQFSPLAPLHNPAHLIGIKVAKSLFPNIPHVAVFDTAFFQQLPAASSTYALNAEVGAKYSIRRYGAHGTSHQFVSGQVAKILARKDLRQVVLHLGNGASASAVVGGKPVDTSMGLTPLEGLVMGTRCGDIDPATVFHLARVGKMTIDQIDTLFNKESGMKGLCGDNDMRIINQRAEDGDTACQLALDVYIHRLVKYVGSYAAVMGGIDTLTFTAGIGENDTVVRSRLCERLAWLGLELDTDKNAQRSKEARIISTPNSKLTVLVIPTNEEWEIAKQSISLLDA